MPIIEPAVMCQIKQRRLSLLRRTMITKRHKLSAKVREKMQVRATVKNHSSIRYRTPYKAVLTRNSAPLN